jgi:hypothetical protein
MSLYADDASMFIKPTHQELQVIDFILKVFAEASGLVTNMAKTHYYPIRCAKKNLEFLEQENRDVFTFPCIYLGLPLYVKKPTRAEL